MSILALTTGGTIGALATPDPQKPPQFVLMPPDGIDVVRDVLKEKFIDFNVRCISLDLRDSKKIDETYLQNIVSLIEAAAEEKILITFGTDYMLQAAEFLYNHMHTNFLLKKKMIVLTGAMVPLANGPESDGYLNLAFALQKLTEDDDQNIRETYGPLSIVLCDYEFPEAQTGAWRPRLYPYQSGRYEKVYTNDGRYNRLRQLT